MEHKISKYFKYTIVEIILVMTGILVALQINIWNPNRKVKIDKQKVLKRLQKDLKMALTNG